jgi:hypothetical protein
LVIFLTKTLFASAIASGKWRGIETAIFENFQEEREKRKETFYLNHEYMEEKLP